MGLLAFSGARTRLVLAIIGPLGAAELVQALSEAADAHGAEFVADRADASTRVSAAKNNHLEANKGAFMDKSVNDHGAEFVANCADAPAPVSAASSCMSFSSMKASLGALYEATATDAHGAEFGANRGDVFIRMS